MKGKREKENENENPKMKIAIVAIISVLAIIAIILAVMVISSNNTVTISDDIDYQEIAMDENAGDYVKEEVDNNNGANVILPGWTTLKIPANTKDITRGIDFYNPKGNEGYYYLTFKLILNDEVLYESGLVAPGKHIQHITLSRPLSAGEYDATIFMQPYKWDKKTPTNNGNVRIKLVVAS